MVLLLGLLVIPRWMARPNWQAANQIREGMTRPEVEAILGCAPGAYGTHEPVALYDHWQLDKAELHADGFTCLVWTDDHHALMVEFEDESGHVSFFQQPAVGPGWFGYEAGFLDALRWRFQRQWRKWFPG
jgi:hypothetical protein